MTAAMVVLVLALALVQPLSLPSPPSPRAFAAIEAFDGFAGNTAGGQQYPVTYPTSGGGIQTGDLLVLVSCIENTAPDTHAGWTLDWLDSSTGGVYTTCAVFHKVAAGGETGTMTWTYTGIITSVAWNIFRIVGEATADPRVYARITGNTIDPPSITPPGGPLQFLWIASATFMMASIGDNYFSGHPTDYTPVANPTGNNASVINMWSTFRTANASTEDPSTYSTTQVHIPPPFNKLAISIAIYPKLGQVVTTGTATSIGSESVRIPVTLNWAFSSTISLSVQYGTDPGNLTQETSAYVVSGPASHTFYITGLSGNTTYYYRAHSLETPSSYEGFGSTLSFTTEVATITNVTSYLLILAFISLLTLMLMGAWWVKQRRSGG